MPTTPTWLEIDLFAIRNNARRLAALAGEAQVMAVVKANAYGHGAVPVAQAALQAGARWLGVARVDEGLALRAAGLSTPVLVLGYTPPAQAAEAIAAGLALTVFDAETAAAYAAAARAQGRAAAVHVKVDSGMGRLGVLPGEAPALFQALRGLAGLSVEGVFTHFAAADSTDPAFTRRQIAAFSGVLAALEAAGLRPPLTHAANSAGTLAYPEARYTLVRCGIALYGLDPSSAVPCPPEFIPALTWKTCVAQVKTLPAGHGVSYGPAYVTPAPERVAVLPVGYADGYRRVPAPGAHHEVLIGGQRAPVRGRVCMDQIVVGVDHLPAVRPGDEVVLLGAQGSECISAEELAHRWGTINYEVTSGVMGRVERTYVG
jgi:alanine racemase